MKKQWETAVVRKGEEQPYLDDGWEPYAVSPHDTSYEMTDNISGRRVTEHQTTDFIHLRRVKP